VDDRVSQSTYTVSLYLLGSGYTIYSIQVVLGRRLRWFGLILQYNYSDQSNDAIAFLVPNLT
jgi:hypothetical protein